MRLVQRPFDVSKKRITTEQLKPGMFLVGVYQSWWKSPFFRHHRIIKNQHEIDLLLQAGIQEVMIDTSLGPDPGEQEEQLHIRDESPASSSPLDGELGSMEFHDQEGMHTDPLSDLSASWEAARLFREDAIFAVEGIFEGLKTGNNNRSSTVPTDRQAPIRPGIKSRCHSC